MYFRLSLSGLTHHYPRRDFRKKSAKEEFARKMKCKSELESKRPGAGSAILAPTGVGRGTRRLFHSALPHSTLRCGTLWQAGEARPGLTLQPVKPTPFAGRQTDLKRDVGEIERRSVGYLCPIRHRVRALLQGKLERRDGPRNPDVTGGTLDRQVRSGR